MKQSGKPLRILVLALSGIGDALMFTPALRLLRETFRDAQIDILVMFHGARDIFERNPHVTKTIHFDFLGQGTVRSLRFLYGLRGDYDATISIYPSNRKEYNVVHYVIGAKRRLAIRYLRKDFLNLGFLNSERVREDDAIHNVEENVRLVELLAGKEYQTVPALELPLTGEDREQAAQSLVHAGISNDDLVVGFHPGCSTLKNHEKRRWEPEKFAALARKLISDYRARILLFGGPDEDDLRERIRALTAMPEAVNVRTGSLAHTAAVMARCRCFVTNDSSLMHVAAALRLRTVAIIGPTNPSYIRPWKTEHALVRLNLDCSPCFVYSPRPLVCSRRDVLFKCIRELTMEHVYAAVRGFLS